MNKKSWFISAYLFLLVLLLVACKSGTPTSEVEVEQPISVEERMAMQAELMNKTKLTLFHPSMTTEEFITIYGKSIVEKYPAIEIEVLNSKDGKIDELILTGTNIDIIGGMGESFINVLKELDATTDLSPWIKKHQYDLSTWDPVVTEFMQRYNGGIMTSIPHTTQTLAMYYNVDLFSKFGVPAPTKRWTWDDVKELNRRLTREDGGILYWGYDTRNAPNFFTLNQFSLPLIDADHDRVMFQNDDISKYMGNLVDIVKSHGMDVFAGPGNQLDLFVKEQRLAMVSTMNTNFRTFDNPSLNWDIAPFPEWTELPGVGPQPQVPTYFIPGTSKNIEAAFLALVEITSYEGQLELAKNGRVSILRDPKMKQVFGEKISLLEGKNRADLVPDKYAALTPYNEYKGMAGTELGAAYTAVVNGLKDINTAIREAAESVSLKIEEAKAMNK